MALEERLGNNQNHQHFFLLREHAHVYLISLQHIQQLSRHFAKKKTKQKQTKKLFKKKTCQPDGGTGDHRGLFDLFSEEHETLYKI